MLIDIILALRVTPSMHQNISTSILTTTKGKSTFYTTTLRLLHVLHAKLHKTIATATLSEHPIAQYP